jgi:hypothetical protein|tara:strand:+ start:96 stop:512 length:417 start_codon:yes stop_codon:yes gene_type:complete
MNRSIEILKILRTGMQSMVSDEPDVQIHYTRIFNFSEGRVSLRMEVESEESGLVPMGRVDVVEIPSNNGRTTCNCTLTELQTGQEQRVVLRLKDASQREKECDKVFSFFRTILSISEKKPLDGGFSSTRGAQGSNTSV